LGVVLTQHFLNVVSVLGLQRPFARHFCMRNARLYRQFCSDTGLKRTLVRVDAAYKVGKVNGFQQVGGCLGMAETLAQGDQRQMIAERRSPEGRRRHWQEIGPLQQPPLDRPSIARVRFGFAHYRFLC
jgi:hypothetical protein